MKSELIADCQVVGIHNMGLSECLQADEKLMLDKSKKAIRIKEAVHEHASGTPARRYFNLRWSVSTTSQKEIC